MHRYLFGSTADVKVQRHKEMLEKERGRGKEKKRYRE
jgi:hypothetical protein